MTVIRSNLIAALQTAIYFRETDDKKRHGQAFESIQVAGWKEVLRALHNGDSLWIKD